MYALASVLVFCCIIAGVSAGYPIQRITLSVVDPLQDKTVDALVYYPVTNGSVGKFPLLVFSPGFIFRYTFYDYLWSTLVPLGYVMAVAGTYGYNPISYPLWKARDEAFLLDYLRNQSVTNRQSPLYGLIGGQSAVMGHSEGGMASLIAADRELLNDEYSCNFSAIVDLSGCFPDFEEEPAIGVKHEKIPILFLTGDKDCICPPSKSLNFYGESVSPCKTFINLVDGGHCYFANPGPVDDVLCYDLEILSGCGFVSKLPKDTQLQRILDVTVPWLQWQLKGMTSARKAFEAVLKLYQSQGKLQYQAQCSTR